ncbi:6-carboxy-5,6,7,8-tetrahydropterin synthase [Pandoraea pneumonica]|jgi:6-pyruvoyltetrahydropterin/6-carboxytetrahydropterin synthase|uniref:6-carboxy-5,6,7,8-tetrahydropterin synthase n=1 Tax=Pandoraea pneumonica TaxID=2508299 RepID=A0A5E4V7J0_9BURK|nr:6-carboxytetrahydropterin synthase [Pandoraea pneumonica]VVE08208.1 6-carboxy-5,6,7,8-tetrahydropterin synthase [Pandoraea pneumonica]
MSGVGLMGGFKGRGGVGGSHGGAEMSAKAAANANGAVDRAQFTLSRSFVFEAAHTLARRDIDPPSIDASRRIHGHSYRATVEVTGKPQGETGMVLDLAIFDDELSRVRERLDHRLLDDVAGLGPATLENLCSYIWRTLAPQLAGLSRVTVSRDARGDACSLVVSPS